VAVPEFRWIEYPLEDAGGAASGIVADLLPAGLAPGAAPRTIPLPDLTAWQSPLDKAEILLESAAEIEHALMVQYLYAAYSLKSSDEVTDDGQAAVLDDVFETSWPQVIKGVAREEMGHLMTVQNLLLALGLPPNLEREDFPPRKELYPFALHLEPLTQRSVAKYVVAEAPSDAAGIDDIIELAQGAGKPRINRVGVLYGLLGVVFATAEQIEASWSATESTSRRPSRVPAAGPPRRGAGRGRWTRRRDLLRRLAGRVRRADHERERRQHVRVRSTAVARRHAGVEPGPDLPQRR